MDALQAKHAFDQIDGFLNQVKEDVLNNAHNRQPYEDLEDEYYELKRELSEMEDKQTELENRLDKYKDAVKKAIQKIEAVRSDIANDYPTYDIEDLDEAQNILQDI